jgi:hypothetical protein
VPDGFAPEGIEIALGNTFYTGSRTTGAIYTGSLLTGAGRTLVQGDTARPGSGSTSSMHASRRRRPPISATTSSRQADLWLNVTSASPEAARAGGALTARVSGQPRAAGAREGAVGDDGGADGWSGGRVSFERLGGRPGRAASRQSEPPGARRTPSGARSTPRARTTRRRSRRGRRTDSGRRDRCG